MGFSSVGAVKFPYGLDGADLFPNNRLFSLPKTSLIYQHSTARGNRPNKDLRGNSLNMDLRGNRPNMDLRGNHPNNALMQDAAARSGMA